ncbi:MAG: APC family permease [bacterium]
MIVSNKNSNIKPQLKPTLFQKLITLIIGGARSPYDRHIFHKISLIAFFAWMGLGADGISSSCYGPQEAFINLGQHIYLGLFVALGTAITIFIISASYSQIIEQFPTGGGGYLVASKLLSPTIGVVSGCALIIDYTLTIAVSITSGVDALFSFLPPLWYQYKLFVAIVGVLILVLLNMRGIKESVLPLTPIFLTFILTHAFFILYSIISNSIYTPQVITATANETRNVSMGIGFTGMMFIILRSYSMGAGTFTGIEAVSNALPILREPQVETAKKTMRYMAISLAFMAMGLMISYLLFQTQPVFGKTLNAVLFDKVTSGWGDIGHVLVIITLVSETALLFVAAQTGFLGGPRILANMALDHWMPSRFASLSNRFVAKNGILLMGIAAIITMILTGGSIRTLVILYSINVFITFTLSQLGMVRHWWQARKVVKNWLRKLFINGIGLILTSFILITVSALKFHQGGWVTLFVTGSLIFFAFLIKRHYINTNRMLHRLDSLVRVAESSGQEQIPGITYTSETKPDIDTKAKTAVLFVNGFNGLGLHTLFHVVRLFGGVFKNYVFIQIGILDTGNFKGISEVKRLKEHTEMEVNKYVEFIKRQGYYAESYSAIGTDAVEEICKLAPLILERFPQAVFFGGQLVFPEDTIITRMLHNHVVFDLQRRFYHLGVPFVILPIRV